LCACNSPSEEPAPLAVAATTTTPPPVFDKLRATIGGKPFAVTRAMIKRMPSGRAQVFLGNYSATCQELLDNVFPGGKGREEILVNTSTRLAPDGTQSTIVSDLIFDGLGDLAAGTVASVGSFATKSVDVALDFKGTTMAKAPVEIHGSFAAENCGDQRPDSSGVPKVAHPSTATITIAGKQLPLRGALREGDAVMLSVSPRDCSSWIPWAEMRLDRKFGSWRVWGDWFGQEYMDPTDDQMKKVKIVAGAKGTSADGPTVQLQLSGAGTVAKYPVAIAGTIEAIDCPKD
ncbi:MAG: hypothetical protein ABI678_26770, partial [Kofleriaceae bacterium]